MAIRPDLKYTLAFSPSCKCEITALISASYLLAPSILQFLLFFVSLPQSLMLLRWQLLVNWLLSHEQHTLVSLLQFTSCAQKGVTCSTALGASGEATQSISQQKPCSWIMFRIKVNLCKLEYCDHDPQYKKGWPRPIWRITAIAKHADTPLPQWKTQWLKFSSDGVFMQLSKLSMSVLISSVGRSVHPTTYSSELCVNVVNRLSYGKLIEPHKWPGTVSTLNGRTVEWKRRADRMSTTTAFGGISCKR